MDGMLCESCGLGEVREVGCGPGDSSSELGKGNLTHAGVSEGKKKKKKVGWHLQWMSILWGP